MISQKEKSKLHPVAKFLAVSTTITQKGLISKKKILKNNKKNKEKPREEAKINLKEFLTHQLDFTDEQKMSAKYFLKSLDKSNQNGVRKQAMMRVVNFII